MQSPKDADARRAIKPVICYPPETLPPPDLDLYRSARAKASRIAEITVPPREARTFRANKGQFFRISSVEGSQVGYFNLYNARITQGFDGDLYHHCCHSNLTRALAEETGLPVDEAEPLVHDVLNVFMCTGFTRDTGQYFMKASPVRPGDYIEMFAEMDLLGNLSACPGGDCSTTHSSDEAACHPLLVSPKANTYDRSHGLKG